MDFEKEKEKALYNKLADLKAEVQVLEDELYALSLKEFMETGRLNSTALCENTQKYEDCVLSMRNLEDLLKQKENEKSNVDK